MNDQSLSTVMTNHSSVEIEDEEFISIFSDGTIFVQSDSGGEIRVTNGRNLL